MAKVKRIDLRKTCYGFAIFFIFALLTAHGVFAGEIIQLKDANGQVLLSFKKGGNILAESQTFQYKKWGRNRLKLLEAGTDQGVFLKRFSVKLKIRDLKGTMLHVVLKAGIMLKVRTPAGDNLVMVKMSPDKTIVSEYNGQKLFTVIPDRDKVLFKDETGQTRYVLEGETRPVASAFLCLPELSLPERIACYLLYRDIFH